MNSCQACLCSSLCPGQAVLGQTACAGCSEKHWVCLIAAGATVLAGEMPFVLWHSSTEVMLGSGEHLSQRETLMLCSAGGFGCLVCSRLVYGCCG